MNERDLAIIDTVMKKLEGIKLHHEHIRQQDVRAVVSTIHFDLNELDVVKTGYEFKRRI